MSALVALSVAIGVLAGVATWGFLFFGGVLVWAAFIAWGCFFHIGGDMNALRKTIIGNVFGVVCAWIDALIILGIPLAGALTLPVWAAIVVGVTVLLICLAAHIEIFNVIPASFYGYAPTFAFLLQTPEKLALPKLLSASLDNALIVVSLSMIIGALFGIVSAKLGPALAASK